MARVSRSHGGAGAGVIRLPRRARVPARLARPHPGRHPSRRRHPWTAPLSVLRALLGVARHGREDGAVRRLAFEEAPPAAPRPASRRLAAAVPPPRVHTVRYAGVLASASKWRALVIPPPTPEPTVPPPRDDQAKRGGKRSRYWRWAELLRRTFGLDPEICDRYGGPMKIIALVTEPDSIARYVRHLRRARRPNGPCPPRQRQAQGQTGQCARLSRRPACREECSPSSAAGSEAAGIVSAVADAAVVDPHAVGRRSVPFAHPHSSTSQRRTQLPSPSLRTRERQPNASLTASTNWGILPSHFSSVSSSRTAVRREARNLASQPASQLSLNLSRAALGAASRPIEASTDAAGRP
jgi:hypothetical protein